MGLATAASTAGGSQTPIYLAVVAPPPTSPFNPADFWLVDVTANQAGPHQVLGLVNAEWRAISGVTNRYYSIPADRFADSLIAGSTGAGWVGLTKGQMLGSFTTATVTTYQAATWFEAWAPVTSDGTYVADLTRGDKAPAGGTLATPSQ